MFGGAYLLVYRERSMPRAVIHGTSVVDKRALYELYIIYVCTIETTFNVNES